MTQRRRFIVEYETNGEDSMCFAEFPTKDEATAFAARITTDDTAWPAEARIFGEYRESEWHRWQQDYGCDPFDVICGEVH